MFRQSVAALMLVTGLSACVSLPESAGEGIFMTDTQAAPVAFEALRLESGQTVIRGQVRLTGHEPVHFGHVDYAVLDRPGQVREQGWVEHSSAIRLRNTHRPALFTIRLQRAVGDGEKVRLTYHTGRHS